MFSNYLNIEIPDTGIQMKGDNNEVITIMSHSVLEDIVFNVAPQNGVNISVHYTPIPTNEPRHYVFLCSMTDGTRRVESIGESLDATLVSEISRNYPTLMAFKRAFDDAAIKFLMLPGKVYSDQQIDNMASPTSAPAPSTESAASSNHFAAPPLDDELVDFDKIEVEEPTPTPAPATTEEKSETIKEEPIETVKPEESAEPVEETAEKAKKTTRKTRTSKATDKSTAKSTKSTFSAPPLDGFEEDYVAEDTPVEETEDDITNFAPSNFGAPDFDDEPEVVEEEVSETPEVEEPIEASEPSETAKSAADDSRFDKPISYGFLKNRKPALSIREAYEAYPKSVIWIAETMTAYNDDAKEAKQLCAEYLRLMRGEA
jgi:hypothetical protein